MPKLNRLEAALFDLDGVIAPTSTLHERAWAETLGQYLAQFPIQSAFRSADYREFIDGRIREDGICAFLTSRNLQTDPRIIEMIARKKNAAYQAILADEAIAPNPGVSPLLEQLKVRGVKCGLFTGSRNAQVVLAAIGLAEAFDVVVDGSLAKQEGLASKPAPDLPLHCARALGADPARCILFEDAISGIVAGRAGGFGRVIGLAQGEHASALRKAGADQVVATLDAFDIDQVLQ